MFVPILTYHNVQPTYEVGISYITARQFEQQVKFLHENGFRGLSIDEYVHQRNLSARSVIITFDDAYQTTFETAFPILRQYGFTATVVVITKFVGDWNSWDAHFQRFKIRHCNWQQLRTLSDAGWEIGSHTVTHSNLRFLNERQLWHELRYSKDVIEHRIGRSVNVMSYPFGWYNHDVILAVRKAGYEAACTLGYNQPSNHHFPYALFRRGIYFFEPLTLFKRKLANGYWSQCDDLKQKLFSRASQTSLLWRSSRFNLKTS